EATEGGAGVLTRLVSEETSLASVARRALQVMHLAVGEEGLPDRASDLSDQPGAACVAACYRCLMSYYNQPDHELLDRRDQQARRLLLRLAFATTSGLDSSAAGSKDAVPTKPAASPLAERWRTEARRRGLPPPHTEPLTH